MGEHYDVIVVGVGSMGASACYHLAKRGVKVLGLDSQSVPNTNSSYNGNTRVISFERVLLPVRSPHMGAARLLTPKYYAHLLPDALHYGHRLCSFWE